MRKISTIEEHDALMERMDALREAGLSAQREQLLSIEAQVREVINANPETYELRALGLTAIEQLNDLLLQRRMILNMMYQLTPPEYRQMARQNERLQALTESLYSKMDRVYADVMAAGKDKDFDDDIEVEGTLRFVFDGELSVFELPQDDYYGSDFRMMIAVQEQLMSERLTDCLPNIVYLHNEKKPFRSAFDDGQSWAHELCRPYEGLNICHTLAALSSYQHFCDLDILRLNSFWSEVTVKYQHFDEQ